ncbi:MAG: hypothetical protein WAK22_20750 [Candidatus Sulfotelmatobacter sp.]
MTCAELQESLAEAEDGSTAEQRVHLRNCPACAALVKELNLIVTAAGGLQDADEPSPRVWNSIEIALRREGLIRPQQTGRSLAHSLLGGLGGRWLVPATAVLLVAAGLFVRGRLKVNDSSQPQATATAPEANQPDLNRSDVSQSDLNRSNVQRADLNDNDLMQEVDTNAPAMKEQYEQNLQRVNESIRDAQSVVDEDPNDEDARRSLLDAYQQKSMLFELAMDRSMP